ncbi:hypothetical protein Mapa_016074 [Marchantia paleacea]|nr:hypothetical protein Mapa_016074 [Marchantia paleacea]
MMRVVEAIPDYARRVCRLEVLILLAIAFLLSEKGLFHSEADSEDSTAYLKLRPSKLPRSLQPSSVNHPKDPSSLIHDSVFLEDVPGEVHGRIILAESASGPMATGSDAIVVAQSPGSPNPPSHNGLLP